MYLIRDRHEHKRQEINSRILALSTRSYHDMNLQDYQVAPLTRVQYVRRAREKLTWIIPQFSTSQISSKTCVLFVGTLLWRFWTAEELVSAYSNNNISSRSNVNTTLNKSCLVVLPNKQKPVKNTWFSGVFDASCPWICRENSRVVEVNVDDLITGLGPSFCTAGTRDLKLILVLCTGVFSTVLNLSYRSHKNPVNLLC